MPILTGLTSVERAAAGDLFEVASAGSKPAGYVHPLAVRAMAEVGLDISGHHSKHMNEFLTRDIHTVITVCGNADQACPMFPGQVNRHHWGFYDPAHATGSEAEQFLVFQRVRDEIRRVFEAYAAGRLDQRFTSGIEMLDVTIAGKGGANLLAFTGLIDQLRERTRGLTLREIIEQMLDTSGLVDFYKAEKEGAERIENLAELVNAAEAFVTQEGFGKDVIALPVDETHPLHPESPYGITKLFVEKYAMEGEFAATLYLPDTSDPQPCLLEALPYIHDFRGSTFVVKYGGSFMDDPDPAARLRVAADVAFLAAVGINVVVVHGGGKAITKAMAESGLKAN